MIEIVGSIVAIWLAVLKTREHFKKYPITKKENPPEITE